MIQACVLRAQPRLDSFRLCYMGQGISTYTCSLESTWHGPVNGTIPRIKPSEISTDEVHCWAKA